MTAEEVRTEIDRVCRQDWAVELAPLAERLCHSDASKTFHILFEWAAHSQDRGPAAPAAYLLWKINPRCLISCREAIQEMLIDWDASIEEVPFYLANQFGAASVRTTLSELRATQTEPLQLTLLDTIDYWLKKYDEAFST